MNYVKLYNSLIHKALHQQEEISQEYHEKHHIVPRCVGGTNSSNNIIKLTGRQHFIAHYILTKIYPNNLGIQRAFMLLCNTKQEGKPNSRTYHEAKKMVSLYMQQNNPMKNPHIASKMQKTKMKNKKPPRKLTEKEKKDISIRMKNKNPAHGLMPWQQSRQNPESLKAWKSADLAYKIWTEHNCNIGYHRMQKLIGHGPFKSYENMIKLFKAGWHPLKDQRWLTFKNQPEHDAHSSADREAKSPLKTLSVRQ